MFDFNTTHDAVLEGHNFKNEPIVHDGSGVPFELRRCALVHFGFVTTGPSGDGRGNKNFWFKNVSPQTIVIDGEPVRPNQMHYDEVPSYDV